MSNLILQTFNLPVPAIHIGINNANIIIGAVNWALEQQGIQPMHSTTNANAKRDWFQAGKTRRKSHGACYKQFHNHACASAVREEVEYLHAQINSLYLHDKPRPLSLRFTKRKSTFWQLFLAKQSRWMYKWPTTHQHLILGKHTASNQSKHVKCCWLGEAKLFIFCFYSGRHFGSSFVMQVFLKKQMPIHELAS